MTAFLVVCAVASRWATTQARRSLIGLGQQVAAAVAVLTLASVTGTFAAYAMPGIMLTAVFGFSVTRPPFLGSVGLGIFYCLAFLSVAVTKGLGSGHSADPLPRKPGGEEDDGPNGAGGAPRHIPKPTPSPWA